EFRRVLFRSRAQVRLSPGRKQQHARTLGGGEFAEPAMGPLACTAFGVAPGVGAGHAGKHAAALLQHQYIPMAGSKGPGHVSVLPALVEAAEIGRASCRERVCVRGGRPGVRTKKKRTLDTTR